MKTRIIAVTCVLVAVAAGLLMSWQQKRGVVGSKQSEAPADAAILKAKPAEAVPTVNREPLQDQPVVEASVVSTSAPADQSPSETKSPRTTSPRTAQRSNPGTQVPPPARTGKPPPRDPVARVALSAVGADADAEEYWYFAINDPDLSAQERQDLIEDLNETGLIDPRNPVPDDLPIIINRLTLIEELAPDAMDQVNFDAFQEAYKDLVNLLARMQER
jgi:hypothetical protein